MFAYCDICNKYDSGDRGSMEELKQKVKEDGGRLEYGNCKCPVCGAEGDSVLGID